MKIWARLQHYYSFFIVSDVGITEKEREYIKAKEDRRFDGVASKFLTSAALIMLLSALATFVLSPYPQKFPQSLTHLVVAVFLIFMRLAFARSKFNLRPAILVAQYLLTLGYAWTLRVTFSQVPDINDVAILSAIFIAIMIFNIALFPFKNGLVVFTAFAHVAITYFAWSASPILKPFDWIFVASLCAAFAIAVFYFLTYLSRNEALGELATRQLLNHRQTNRILALQRDMEVAGEIQDSIAPRESIVTGHGLKVSFYQIKFDLLGGDWCAVRSFDSGDLVLVVADATGKGIQAALVIHSIQTLWANALSSPTFDSETWLNSANRTLIALGQRKEHTMSLGLVIIRKETVTYYSAGHLPLFLVLKVEDKFQVQTLIARGSLLGMSENLQLQPREITRSGLWIEALLLGTDGVFEGGSSYKNRTVLELVSRVRARGAAALEDCPAQDDKLLVWVEQTA